MSTVGFGLSIWCNLFKRFSNAYKKGLEVMEMVFYSHFIINGFLKHRKPRFGILYSGESEMSEFRISANLVLKECVPLKRELFNCYYYGMRRRPIFYFGRYYKTNMNRCECSLVTIQGCLVVGQGRGLESQ